MYLIISTESKTLELVAVFYQFLVTFVAVSRQEKLYNRLFKTMLIDKYLTSFGKYLILMGRAFSRPERMRMFMKQYLKEMSSLGVNSIGIVLLISFLSAQ